MTSMKDSAAGMALISMKTGVPLCPNYKNCMSESGSMCTIGSSSSSFCGLGSSGDFVAVAQSKKPAIHIWQWAKPQPHFQCHIQEVVTALCPALDGQILLAGTRNGWIYCWDVSTGELIINFQAHFRAITRILVTQVGCPFAISVSEDGTARAWELHKIVDFSEAIKLIGRNSMTPYR